MNPFYVKLARERYYNARAWRRAGMDSLAGHWERTSWVALFHAAGCP